LLACNALDYHDFINFSVRLLKEHPEVLAECQKTWTCVLVDEFQDTSTMQYNFLHLLASHNRITVVGDDDQSIFSFNGADSSGFDSFRKDFPQLKEVCYTQYTLHLVCYFLMSLLIALCLSVFCYPAHLFSFCFVELSSIMAYFLLVSLTETQFVE
jgi:hypothetical protein